MLVEPRIHCLCVVHLASNIYPQQRARLNLVRANLGDVFLAHANLGVFFLAPANLGDFFLARANLGDFFLAGAKNKLARWRGRAHYSLGP